MAQRVPGVLVSQIFKKRRNVVIQHDNYECGRSLCVYVCVCVCVPEETQGFVADCRSITVFKNSACKMQQVS